MAKTMSAAQARKNVKEALDGGLPWLLNQGHAWVLSSLAPAVEVLAAGSDSDRGLAAHGYYLLGDLWDVNDAPLAAIKAYKKCLQIEPEAAVALREIAWMHAAMGELEKAVTVMKKAARQDPMAAADDLEELTEDPPEALYEEGDPAWQAAEALAAGKTAAAMGLLEGKKTVPLRKWRACALGAAGDASAVIAEWQGLAKTRGPVTMEYPDWFYLPEPVWSSPSFWEALISIGDRFEMEGLYPCDAGLEDVLPEPEHEEDEHTDDCMDLKRERTVLMLQHYLARARHDREALEALAEEYPGWVEIGESLKELAALGE